MFAPNNPDVEVEAMFRADEQKTLEELLADIDAANGVDTPSTGNAVDLLEDDVEDDVPATPAAQDKASPQVPLAAVMAERGKRQEAEGETAELRAKIEELEARINGTSQNPDVGSAPEPAAPKYHTLLENEIAEVDKEIGAVKQQFRSLVLTLAKQKDDGRLTEEEYETKRLDMEEKRDELLRSHTSRIDDLKDKLRRPSPDEAIAVIERDTQLSEATAALVEQNKWLDYIPQKAFDKITQEAAAAMERELGRPIDPTDTSFATNYRLRQLFVEVGKEYGYDRLAIPQTNQQPSTDASGKDNGIRAEINGARAASGGNGFPPTLGAAGYAGVDNPVEADLSLAANPNAVMEQTLNSYNGKTVNEKLEALARELES